MTPTIKGTSPTSPHQLLNTAPAIIIASPISTLIILVFLLSIEFSFLYFYIFYTYLYQKIYKEDNNRKQPSVAARDRPATASTRRRTQMRISKPQRLLGGWFYLKSRRFAFSLLYARPLIMPCMTIGFIIYSFIAQFK